MDLSTLCLKLDRKDYWQGSKRPEKAGKRQSGERMKACIGQVNCPGPCFFVEAAVEMTSPTADFTASRKKESITE